MALFELSLPSGKLKASFRKHVLNFKKPAGTSRGVMNTKDCYLLEVYFEGEPNTVGTGECSPLWGLSIDPEESYEPILTALCQDINNYNSWLNNKLVNYPSILFGLEMALKDLESNGKRIFFPSNFTKRLDSVEINGLVWMGELSFMKEQIKTKLKDGYDCIKLKIGALNFDQEVQLIQSIREQYSKEELAIRVDANGAFSVEEAMDKLKTLNKLALHSIEQPIKAGNWNAMKSLCTSSPLPIALDEELIGVVEIDQQRELLQTIQPQYLILKPSLLGGFKATEQWIQLAEENNIAWWITSALESNVGLNAIAQFTYASGNKLPQGLGTGSLYTNNIGEVDFLKSNQFYFKEFNIPSNTNTTNS